MSFGDVKNLKVDLLLESLFNDSVFREAQPAQCNLFFLHAQLGDIRVLNVKSKNFIVLAVFQRRFHLLYL